jgi:hypothetical protein
MTSRWEFSTVHCLAEKDFKTTLRHFAAKQQIQTFLFGIQFFFKNNT